MIRQSKILTSGIKVVFMLSALSSTVFAHKAEEIVESVCYACHGEQMEQSCYGVSQIPNTLKSSHILETLRAYRAGSRNKYGMGVVMSKQVGSLNDEELEELSVYIPTLK